MHLYEKNRSGNNSVAASVSNNDATGSCFSLPSATAAATSAATAARARTKSVSRLSSSSQGVAKTVLSRSLSGDPGLAAASVAAATPGTQGEEEEERLVREVRQKLNALLLYKYQHNKATR